MKVFLTLIISISFASQLKREQAVINNTSLEKSLSLSRKDVELAQKIRLIFDMNDKGKRAHTLTKQAIKLIKRSETFTPYKKWLRTTHRLSQTFNSKVFQAECAKVLPREKSGKRSLEMVLQDNLRKTCFHRIGQGLLYGKMRALDVFKGFLPLFHDNISNALFNDLFEKLTKYNKENHKKVSYIYSRFLMQNKEVPSQAILSNMEIDATFTRYIQLNFKMIHKTKWLLAQEMKDYRSDAVSALDDNDMTDEEVKKVVHNALLFFQKTYDSTNKTKAKISLFSLARSLTRRGLFIQSRKVLRTLLSKDKGNEDYLAEYLWGFVKEENFQGALVHIIGPNRYLTHFSDIKSARLQFWTAFSLDKLSINKSELIFKNLIEKNPLNYYSIMALKSLKESSSLPTEQVYAQLAFKNNIKRGLASLTELNHASLKRLRLWGRSEYSPLISAEVRELFKKEKSAEMTLLASKALSMESNYLESFKLIYEGLNNQTLTLDNNVLSLLFPKPFYKMVKKHAKFDPIIALSLIRQESGFNETAKSWAGARGLMQLMLPTARRFKRRIKSRQLYRPQTNIWLGTKLISNLLERYDKNLVHVLAAYNAGESRVERWKKKFLTHDEITHNLESIPFDETRKYVKLIFRNLYFYKLLEESDEKNDKNSPNKIFDIHLGYNG